MPAVILIALGCSAAEAKEAERVSVPSRKQLIICANDAGALGKQRRHCVFELFRQHVKAGLSFAELLSWGPVSNWFDEHSLFDAAKYSAIPVARVPGQAVFMFKPNLPGDSDAAIYLRVSPGIGRDQLLALTSGNTRDPKLKGLTIVEVGFSEPK
jgi:hypothetical protein